MFLHTKARKEQGSAPHKHIQHTCARRAPDNPISYGPGQACYLLQQISAVSAAVLCSGHKRAPRGQPQGPWGDHMRVQNARRARKSSQQHPVHSTTVRTMHRLGQHRLAGAVPCCVHQERSIRAFVITWFCVQSWREPIYLWTVSRNFPQIHLKRRKKN